MTTFDPVRFAKAIVEKLKSRLDPIEARLAALEARPQLSYSGVWTSDKQYNAGELVTDAGSMWHCNKSTRARPGSSADWVLCVKRGRDGKDLR